MNEFSEWYIPGDKSDPVITAKAQLSSAHRECRLKLPGTAIVFFMSKAVEYLRDSYAARELPEPFPRFLNRCPVWEIPEYGVCFLDGGRGAPQACDTVETLAALGVRKIIAVGMFGAFDTCVTLGEVIVPSKAFVEEGTSLHYFGPIDFSVPSDGLLAATVKLLQIKSFPVVSTDAVYRQTFLKEKLWRSKGAVGVDMETSAVFSVSKYLGLESAALLMVSDIHPIQPGDPEWDWQMTKEMRFDLAEKGLALARHLNKR